MSSVTLIEIRIPRSTSAWQTRIAAEWDKQCGYRVLDGSFPVGTYATAEAAVKAAMRRAAKAYKENPVG
jgi:hypothetical protein